MEKPHNKCFDYEVQREGAEANLVVETFGCMFYPSLEDSPECMSRTIDLLIEIGTVTNITYKAERNYVYPFEQVNLLNQIADAYLFFMKEKKILNPESIGLGDKKSMVLYPEFIAILKRILMDQLKSDPVGAYVSLIRTKREKIAQLETYDSKFQPALKTFITVIDEIISVLEKTDLIRLAKPHIAGYKVGERDIYFKLFEPMISPNFMFTRLQAEPPTFAEEVESYSIGKDLKAEVSILRIPRQTRMRYHVLPPEFQLSEDEYVLLDEAREVMARYKPNEEEFIDPKRMRAVFYNIALDLISQIATKHSVAISYTQIQKLAKILVRLTVGFGMIEVFLQDKLIEDIYINAPIGTGVIFVKHAKYGECETNVVPSMREADSWASRFRLISGRPLDEANPVLDTELIIPDVALARSAIIQNPLSPTGYAFAFRQHRERPWTLPLFIHNKNMTPLAAGLISFLVDGARTMLVAGTRGSGKTSLLSALMVEIMRKYRVITVEDTLELPVDYLKNIGYNILPLKVRSAIIGEKAEVSAEDGIRTSLRLGDSALIIGEVRSKEALALYESMRIGALANIVAGTIHGDSPYGVFDRVVNDLKVPRTSFKATDIILIAGKVRSPDQITENRRLTAITEVRKKWEKDPMAEGGFVNLMSYDAKNDRIDATKDLMEGGSEIVKSIASRVREWAGNWDRVWENIVLRGETRQMIVDYAHKTGMIEGPKGLLESNFIVEANDMYHNIFNKLSAETGYPDKKDVLREYEIWLKSRINEISRE